MKRFLLDAETWSYLLQKHPQVSERMRNALKASDQLILSAVAWYELRRAFMGSEAHQPMQGLREITALFPWCDLTPKDRAQVTILRARVDQTMSDSELIWVAQAQRLNATLITTHPQTFNGLDIPVASWLETKN